MRVLAILSLAAAAVAAVEGDFENQSWKPNTVYEYAVEGRTLTALHQLSKQYSGLVTRAMVEIQHKSSNIISMQVKSAEFSDIHTNLSQGWASSIPVYDLHYQQMQLSKTPIELSYKRGMITEITVSSQMPTWELNLIKSFANQLQVDTRAENIIKSPINSLPSKYTVNGAYKTMEESMGGLCETIYDLSPLPKVVLINKPELAPFPNLHPEGQLIDIVKTRNFSNCDVPVEYHFGITGSTNWKPSSNQMGTFLARSSLSRVIISGNLDYFTIQSSVTTSKVIASPFLFDDQNGMVVSRINMTLVDVRSASSSPQTPTNPKTINNLVYEYEPASPNENKQLSERPIRQWKRFDKNITWRRQTNFGIDASSSSNNHPSARRFTTSIQENDKSTYDHTEKNEPDQVLEQDTLELSHIDWFMKFRPDIYDKIMSLHNENKTASLIHDTARFSSSEFSSPLTTFFSSDDSSNSGERELNNFSFSLESSEEDMMSWHPDMNEAPRVPFLPMFIGNRGNSIQSVKEIQVISAVRSIAQDIGRDILHPSSIPGQMTLSKFSLLTELVETMDVKQMTAAMKELYYSQSKVPIPSSSNLVMYHAWVAFCDAVAQAGTGPALITLKEMIESKKVQGEEAAQLVSILPNSARFPNTEFMNIFFALTTSDVVAEQDFLNTSAIISFTELACKAFVSKSTAYKRFPVDVYSPAVPQKEQPVIQKYIPYFARGLKKAVKEADSNKIRTMITALGNFAHPRILSVFEPFLEGRQPMSKFQRLTIVVALNRLAKVFPNVARPVLFRIYQNTGEATEVRVAAVFQIMKTNPPAQMLQRMAQFTNDDIDLQVVSAVQSAIRSAASLSSLSDYELMMNAQAAVNILSPKELPPQMSKRKVHSYWAKQLNLAYKQAISYIGSDDSFMPSNVFYSLSGDLGGFKRQTIGFSAMTSSLDDTADLMKSLLNRLLSPNLQTRKLNSEMDQTTSERPFMRESSSPPISTEDINNILNIRYSKREQVEASLYITTLLGKRYFTLDNSTIEQLPSMMIKTASALRSGKNFTYTKMTDKMSITVGFPMDSGLPFVFTLKNPTLMMLSGTANAWNEPDFTAGSPMPLQAINITADLHLVYSSHTQSRMGFIAPFTEQHYFSGVNKNIQVNIPVKSETNVDFMKRKVFAKMEMLDMNNKQNVIECSTVPYTAKKNILETVQNPQKDTHPNSNNMKIVHIRSANQIHKTFGQDSTGLAFDFDYHSEQKLIDFATLYNKGMQDPLSAMISAWAEDSIYYNNITLAFNPQKTTAKYAKFAAAILDDSDCKNGGCPNDSQKDSGAASSSMAQATSTDFSSQERQQQFLANVGAGIQDSSMMVLDLSAEFQGPKKASFVATFAAATSYTSSKARYLFFANKDPANLNSNSKQNQVCMAMETTMPNVPIMNFDKALNADPTSYMSAEMVFGEKCSQPSTRITIKGEMKRSQERHQMMQQMPLSQVCKEQMKDGNTVLSACRNVTMHANCMDRYKFSLHFDQVSDYWKNLTYKAYSVMRFINYPHVTEDLISRNNPSDAIEVDANFSPNLSSLNVTIQAPFLSAQFTNLRVDRAIQPLLVVNPEYSAVQRVADYIFQGQQFSTCVVGSSQAETFDGKSYPINVGHDWHLMMHYTPKIGPDIFASDDIQNVSVLIRDATSNNYKEVMIMVGRNTVHMEPSRVTVNDQPIDIKQNRLSQAQDNNGEIFALMYKLPCGAIRMFTLQQNIEFQYDGSAAKIRVPNSYRSKVRGLCGTFNSQPSDDFTVPAGCVMQDPFDFAAMYAIVDTTCQGPRKALRCQAQQSPCFQNKAVFSDIVTDSEVNMNEFEIHPDKKQSKKFDKKDSSCTHKRTMVVEKEGKICFSLKALIQCAENCKPQVLIRKKVDVFCTNHSSATEHWEDMIRQGKTPDFKPKKPTLRLSMKVPESCVP